MNFVLPWPPSTNSYWRHPSKGLLAGRHMISEDGRKYRKAIDAAVSAARGRQGLTTRLRVSVTAFPPDRRRRDLDNLLKPLLDALQHAGVYEDDSQIDELTITRGAPMRFGSVAVTVEELKTEKQPDDAWLAWRHAMGDV